MSTLTILVASLVMASTFAFGIASPIGETKPPIPVEKKGDPTPPILVQVGDGK